jgi:hypothetical protein
MEPSVVAREDVDRIRLHSVQYTRWRITRVLPQSLELTWSAECFEAENIVDARRRGLERVIFADKGLIEKIEVEQVAGTANSL